MGDGAGSTVVDRSVAYRHLYYIYETNQTNSRNYCVVVTVP